ncbi:FixH family protein [Bacillaceae bacterium Marseille-Q3522]|nr:FixH family protein [Bacillaceae bacterium Marseille-Q3522]
MKKYYFIIIAVTALLFGCQEGKEQNSEIPAAVEVTFQLPEKAKVGEDTLLAVTVTQDNQFVDDADEVTFEIWKKDEKEDSKIVEAVYKKEGEYEGKTSFTEEALYYVQVHVTARNMHTMPKETIQVHK